MSILLSAIKIIFLLGFLIFIHEGGHFLMAKKTGVKVEEFSIGFGYKIFKKKYKETIYSVGCIPLGGYVKMLGESEKSSEPNSFNNAKLLNKIGIVIAGPIINIVFAIILYFGLSFFSGYNVSNVVLNIIPEAHESTFQLQQGDKIIKINDKNIKLKKDINKILSKSNGENVLVTIIRNGEKLQFDIKPFEYKNTYVLGVELSLGNTTLKDRIYYSFWGTVDFVDSAFESIKLLFTQKDIIKQMTGPIGISEVVIESNGIYNYIYLISLVSLSLGITNLFPIPALDGGKLLFLVIEGIRGKALKEEIELEIQSIGFFILILFSLYVSYNDILRII